MDKELIKQLNRMVVSGIRSGIVNVVSSKSQMHRLLICSALSNKKNSIIYSGLSDDIKATAECLRTLGADINILSNSIDVVPFSVLPKKKIQLNCGQSGSTLRFILPVIGVLGLDADLYMEGRLPERPIWPFLDVLSEHGMQFEMNGNVLSCAGKLRSGSYNVPGNISSQYISGLLLALPIMQGDSQIKISGSSESTGYVEITRNVMQRFCVESVKNKSGFFINGNQNYLSPEKMISEGDWSGAAFFLCMGALSEKGVIVKNLDIYSCQGDKKIINILEKFGADINVLNGQVHLRSGSLHGIVIDASEIPDLIPVLSVIGSVAAGQTVIKNASRLRLKESDRLASTAEFLRELGADITEKEVGLVINGKKMLDGGFVSSYGDHRIAMSAAVAASVCKSNVVIQDAECTTKSYPGFWDELEKLEVL